MYQKAKEGNVSWIKIHAASVNTFYIRNDQVMEKWV